MTKRRPGPPVPYGAGPYLEQLGLDLLSRADGKSHMWLVPQGWMKNFMGVVHGGILATVADTTAAQAVLSLFRSSPPRDPGADQQHVMLVTTELHTSFLAPVTSSAIEAFGEVIHTGRSLVRARASLYAAESGRRILEAVGCFMLLSSEPD